MGVRPVVDVRTLVQTGDVCPTQWEGRTVGGACLYVRYRSGWLRIGIGDTLDAAVDAAMADDNPLAWRLGGPLDGSLPYEDLIAATAGRFTWPT